MEDLVTRRKERKYGKSNAEKEGTIESQARTASVEKDTDI
jgi:hypothetical protein